MASALALMKMGFGRMDLDHGVRGVSGVVLDSAVGFGASFGLGEVYHRYGDKWYGRHAPKIVAAGGKLAAVAVAMFTGPGLAAGMLDAVGQAGLNAYGLELGLRHARKATGHKVQIVPKNAALPPGGKDVTSIGDLPAGRPGRALSFDQIEEFANMH